jgi:hypothetical protein
MESFFNYFRQRVANIRAIGSIGAPQVANYPGSMLGEQLILATSGIDTLASHWARIWEVSGPQGRLPHAERMVRFLAIHGDAAVWNRLAIPHVIRDSTIALALTDRVRQLPGASTQRGRKRDYREDHSWDDVCTQVQPLAPADESRLRGHMYSAYLYKRYRNVWIHRGAGPGTSMPPWQGLTGDEPYYENWAAESGSRRVLVLPVSLLVSTYEHAIESLQRACVEASKDPFVGIDEE